MGCFVAVPEDRVYVVERCGKFDRVTDPGFHCLPSACGYSVAGTLTKRIQQIYVEVETKTKDNVFLQVTVAIQFEVLRDKEKQYDAFYKLSQPHFQIQSMVEDVVRGAVPTIELDNVFLEKEVIAENVRCALERDMQGYGYRILAALVTDIKPNLQVKEAMNDINASRRLRAAQAENAEAQKIIQVRAAEALADAAHLQGQGMARQRAAIVNGLRDTVEEFTTEVPGVARADVFDLMIINQYFDTLSDLASKKESSVVFLPSRKKGHGRVDPPAPRSLAVPQGAEAQP